MGDKFSFWTFGKYPNNIQLLAPCDVYRDKHGILKYHENRFYVRSLDDTLCVICILHNGYFVDNSCYSQLALDIQFPNNQHRIFNHNISMNQLLEIADSLIIEEIHST